MHRFKEFIERRGHETGGWRGDIDTARGGDVNRSGGQRFGRSGFRGGGKSCPGSGSAQADTLTRRCEPHVLIGFLIDSSHREVNQVSTRGTRVFAGQHAGVAGEPMKCQPGRVPGPRRR